LSNCQKKIAGLELSFVVIQLYAGEYGRPYLYFTPSAVSGKLRCEKSRMR